MKNFKMFALVLVVILVLLELFVVNDKKEKVLKKPIVALSTFALYDIIKHIAPQSVEIVNMIPFGTDPHEFEPTPKLMADIEKSSLVFISGAGLEPWIDTMKFKTEVVDVSKYAKLRKLGDKELLHHDEHHDHDIHKSVDPHYWLDFSNMKHSTNVVTQELIKLLPKNRKLYTKNRDVYLKMLDKLSDAYSKKLATCSKHTLILNHNAVGYLADKYHFHAESLSGLSSEEEPTPSDIQRVFKEIKKDGVSTIFFENFINNKTIKMIASDANVYVDVFQSLGNITADEEKAGITYEKAMLSNLKKLSKALVCN